MHLAIVLPEDTNSLANMIYLQTSMPITDAGSALPPHSVLPQMEFVWMTLLLPEI